MLEIDREYAKKCLELYLKNKFETRDNSWSNCYNYFRSLLGKYEKLDKKEKDFACLQLGFYLASWGMFRNSFLLQYDYTIYDKVLNVVLAKKYSNLWNVNARLLSNKSQKQKFIMNIFKVSDALNAVLQQYKDFYDKKSVFQVGNHNKRKISQTLITKILLGVLGCCPAYDTNFTIALKFGSESFYNQKKFTELVEFVIENKIFAELSNKYSLPIMKIVDIVCFQMGAEKEFKQMYDKYIASGGTQSHKSIQNTLGGGLKKLKKAIQVFYQKSELDGECAINVAFECDKEKVDKFISENFQKNKRL